MAETPRNSPCRCGTKDIRQFPISGSLARRTSNADIDGAAEGCTPEKMIRSGDMASGYLNFLMMIGVANSTKPDAFHSVSFENIQKDNHRARQYLLKSKGEFAKTLVTFLTI